MALHISGYTHYTKSNPRETAGHGIGMKCDGPNIRQDTTGRCEPPVLPFSLPSAPKVLRNEKGKKTEERTKDRDQKRILMMGK